MRTRLAAVMAAILASTGAAFAQDFAEISLSQQQVERLGITVQTVKQANSVAFSELVGRVTRAPDGITTVIAPFAGTVTKTHVPARRKRSRLGAPIATICKPRLCVDSLPLWSRRRRKRAPR
jgi:hypothetical protein